MANKPTREEIAAEIYKLVMLHLSRFPPEKRDGAFMDLKRRTDKMLRELDAAKKGK